MLQAATPDNAVAPNAPETDSTTTPTEHQQFVSALAGHIKHCFTQSEMAKFAEMSQRLLVCQRLRRGVYSPAEAADIKSQGGSDVFVNLTNIKCRAAESWIKDIMLSQGSDKPWTLEATPIPELPADISVAISKAVAQEQAEVEQSGIEVHQDAFDARTQEMHEELLTKLNDVAEKRIENMERKIDDQMKEGGFLKAFRDFVNDFCTFPVAIIKGPVVRKRRVLSWGANGPEVGMQIVREFERVSPFDIYPAPDAIEINDAYLIERHRLFLPDLEAMKGVEGYKDEEIDKVIELYGEKGLRTTRAYDFERDQLENRPLSTLGNRGTIEALQFWGPITGRVLKQWAGSDAEKMKLTTLNDNSTYEIEAWLIGSYVIKAVLNPDPMGKRPYDKACWDEVPGSFWGASPPEIMADVQRMINACARALANNMGIASGPQVMIEVDRLPEGQKVVEEMYPWKIWQVTSDRSGGGHAAITFFQPASNAEELKETMDWFYKKADEVTGIPNYTYGSAQVGGAGRTASGLSMLMENASKGIRQAIANVDGALSNMITRMYNHNMLFEADPEIKGDCRIVAKGALGLVAREAIQDRRNNFLQATANPFDMQIVGVEGRANLLREMVKGLHMDPNSIIPSADKLKAIQAQQQAAAQMGPPQGPPGAPPEMGGPPPGTPTQG